MNDGRSPRFLSVKSRYIGHVGRQHLGADLTVSLHFRFWKHTCRQQGEPFVVGAIAPELTASNHASS